MIQVNQKLIIYAFENYGTFNINTVFLNTYGDICYSGIFKKNGKKMEFIQHKNDKALIGDNNE
jgi:hypothetical protein